MMTLEQLRLFVMVVRHGGFNAAAEAIHRSQPSISNAVKNLENQFDLTLFDRKQYGSHLTEDGKAFYEKVEYLLAHTEEVKEFAESLSKDIESDIAMAIDIFMPLEQYLPLFDRLIKDYPSTHFQFYSDSLGGGIERLLQEKVDIAITDNLTTRDNIETIHLQDIIMLPVATHTFIKDNHNILSHPVRHKELVQVIIRDSSIEQEKYTVGVMKRAQHWTVSDVTTKQQIISAGMGWGRLAVHCIEEELAAGKLQDLTEFGIEPHTLHLSALRLKKNYYGPVAMGVWGALMDLASRN